MLGPLSPLAVGASFPDVLDLDVCPPGASDSPLISLILFVNSIFHFHLFCVCVVCPQHLRIWFGFGF